MSEGKQMIIYNVTIKVNWDIHDKWIAWMKNEHMPEVVTTGCFTGSQLVKLMDINETDGPTYAAQYFANSRSDYDRYVVLFAGDLRDKTTNKWGEAFVAFRTLMEVVR